MKKAGSEIKEKDKIFDTGKLELLVECPFVREPEREIRSGEEYTVVGKRIPNPNAKIEKGKYPSNKA
jgi:hypothetical protein